jgi:hypothetical protein
MSSPVVLSAAVEGPSDEVALRRLCELAGAQLGDVLGRKGKQFILERITGYNHSAKYRHWVVLIDLDDDFPCAGSAIKDWISEPATLMCFRIAVRELEAWLLADREEVSRFLNVNQDLVPAFPDGLQDPKLELVNLARHSKTKAIRDDMVPNQSAGQSEGPAYTSRVIEFIATSWRPEIAARSSPSLRRCIEAIRLLITKPLSER